MGEEIAEREPGETVEGVHDVVTLKLKKKGYWMDVISVVFCARRRVFVVVEGRCYSLLGKVPGLSSVDRHDAESWSAASRMEKVE